MKTLDGSELLLMQIHKQAGRRCVLCMQDLALLLEILIRLTKKLIHQPIKLVRMLT
jgi:hypothetical protein